MTSMPVMGRGLATQNLLSAKTAKPSADFASDNFEKYMSKSEPKTDHADGFEKPSVGEGHEQSKAERVYKKAQQRNVKDAETDENYTQSGEVNKETKIQEEITAAGEQMITIIAQLLGLSPQQVNDVMNQMQLPRESLLQEENVRELMLGLTGKTDAMALLTDESLYQSLTQALEGMQQLVSDLTNELQLSDTQFEQQLTSFLQSQKEELASGKDESFINPVEVTRTEGVEAMTQGATSEKETNTQTEGRTVGESLSEQLSREEMKPQTGNSFDGDTAGQQMSQNMFGTTGASFGQTVQVSFEGAVDQFYMPQTEEIMQQIVDYMRVQMKPEITSLEMQLHPESLGNLHIQISSKEGVVTAQFTAQNLEVKAVLESQMMELKANLEQQGVKVQAVEVTIAEYTLSQGFGERSSNGQEQMNRQKKGRTAITLENVDFEKEEWSQEEKITAEMMQSEGSTVNYTA